MMQDVATTLVKALAHPEENFDEDSFGVIVNEVATCVTQSVCEQFPHIVADVALGAVQPESPSVGSWQGYWSPALRDCLTALRKKDGATAERGVGGVLLQRACQGQLQGLSLRCRQPTQFRWGHLTLPLCDAIDVEVTATEACIIMGGAGGRRTLRLDYDSSTRQWTGPLDALPNVMTGYGQTVLRPPSSVDAGMADALPGTVVEPSAYTKARVTECFQRLASAFPQYAQWTTRVVRELIVVHAPEGRIFSGSFEGAWGMVYVSEAPSEAQWVEMLVHESSHLYFNVLTHAVELVTHHEPIYYSPFVKRLRPPLRLLLAFHAFVNVERFYGVWSSYRALTPWEVTALSTLRAELDAVEATLSQERPLTESGHLFFDALRNLRRPL